LHNSKSIIKRILLEKSAFAKQPVPEKSKFQIHRGVKVIAHVTAWALLGFVNWASTPSGTSNATVPRFFYLLKSHWDNETINLL